MTTQGKLKHKITYTTYGNADFKNILFPDTESGKDAIVKALSLLDHVDDEIKVEELKS